MESKKCLEQVASVFSGRPAKPILRLRHFAVLALFTEIDEELHLVLNKRAAGVLQPGDICFPGGHREDHETLEETALRETEEELGILRQEIQILGKSDYMLTVYRGLIQPFLGYVPYDTFLQARPNPMEVDKIFTVPLSFFLETTPESFDMVWKAVEVSDFPYERIEGGKNYPFRKSVFPELFYEYDGYTIWGLTAQIIQNIVETLKIAEIPQN
ncbi:MAG: CoA pyrophosphatase [Anaerotignum sp.]|nr:CoA pyrophosphatase [Anaerotignum sp.]